MNEFTLKNFEMTRRFFLRNVDGLDEGILDVQPEGFNNTIRWQIGHVLTVTEQFMMGFPKKSSYLPEKYLDLFGKGTRPSEWSGEVPSLSELVEHLKNQVDRLQQIPSEAYNQVLTKPFLGLETFGELANMAAFHEANHLGQIQSMKKIVQNAIVNK
ncbi:DinB family protein [Fictibacillus aquaticus]|uniref:Formate dehydrogenase n=1 Tax=Fictibacillus aquaticus TaxID=2021314 RepID=A0A235FE15_9BACL|nr:DinB family protein [Fictibacillus aquaticus]OYD59452.1 formate dehydrogenase [Fictibacillus aquaticus]